MCSHYSLKAAVVVEVSSSYILSLCSLDWLKVKAEEAEEPMKKHP